MFGLRGLEGLQHARVVAGLVGPALGQRGQREPVLLGLGGCADAPGLFGHGPEQTPARAVAFGCGQRGVGQALALVEVALGAGVPEHAVEPFGARGLQRRERVGPGPGRQHLRHAPGGGDPGGGLRFVLGRARRFDEGQRARMVEPVHRLGARRMVERRAGLTREPQFLRVGLAGVGQEAPGLEAGGGVGGVGGGALEQSVIVRVQRGVARTGLQRRLGGGAAADLGGRQVFLGGEREDAVGLQHQTAVGAAARLGGRLHVGAVGVVAPGGPRLAHRVDGAAFVLPPVADAAHRLRLRCVAGAALPCAGLGHAPRVDQRGFLLLDPALSHTHGHVRDSRRRAPGVRDPARENMPPARERRVRNAHDARKLHAVPSRGMKLVPLVRSGQHDHPKTPRIYSAVAYRTFYLTLLNYTLQFHVK